MTCNIRSHRTRWIALCLALAASLFVADGALAKKKRKSPPPISVANDGMDHADCGSSFDPCRSITQGIARAHALRRARVVLGPGIYGDLNQDGDTLDIGEDRYPVQIDGISVSSIGGASRTIFKVVDTRFLPDDGILSVGDGGALAGLTIAGTFAHRGLRVRGAGAARNVVLHGLDVGAWVEAGGSLVGALVLKSRNAGIFVTGGAVAESIVVGTSRIGFRLDGAGSRATDCQAIRNGTFGFMLTGTDVVVLRGLALANRSDGFTISADRSLLKDSEAVANGARGITVNAADAVLQGSFVAANRGDGLVLGNQSQEARIDRLRAIGNGDDGLEYGTATATVTRSALYSNARCQVWSPGRNTGFEIAGFYAGDPSRCRVSPYRRDDRGSEQQALAIPQPKKKKGKKKKKVAAPAISSPWPLRP